MTSDLQPWVEALSTGRRSNLRLGELAARDKDVLEERLTALKTAGYEPPTPSTLSRYRTVHEYWVAPGLGKREELERVGMSKLHMLASFLRKSTADPLEWLEKAKTLTRDELQAEITQQPLQERQRRLTAPESVVQAWSEGCERFYQLNSHPHESPVAALEVWAAVMNEASPEALRSFWATVHGENS